MTSRKMRLKSEKFDGNITKRGQVQQKKKEEPVLSNTVLGVLLFVVVGSALLQVFRGF